MLSLNNSISFNDLKGVLILLVGQYLCFITWVCIHGFGSSIILRDITTPLELLDWLKLFIFVAFMCVMIWIGLIICFFNPIALFDKPIFK